MLSKKDAQLINDHLVAFSEKLALIDDRLRNIEEWKLGKDDYRPCKFCGSDNVEPVGMHDKEWYAECKNCHATGPVSPNIIEAKKAWNRGM